MPILHTLQIVNRHLTTFLPRNFQQSSDMVLKGQKAWWLFLMNSFFNPHIVSFHCITQSYSFWISCSCVGGGQVKFNKLTSVFYASVLLLMINCVIMLACHLYLGPLWGKPHLGSPVHVVVVTQGPRGQAQE